ncbi:MAG TPA: site-2 protease family protein [Gemmataceae bacterium]|nr:site-2 protease family protein [Gemmataceae bacterium]
MRDPLSWSFPMGRMFGVTVRVHLLFLVFFAASVLRVAFWAPPAGHPKDTIPDGSWIDICIILGLLFLSVLAHEFGHAFGARFVGGDCQEILMWPLGGLAYVDVPHTPRANFLTTAAGPAVNLFLCIICALLLLLVHTTPLLPPLNPLAYTGRDFSQMVSLAPWGTYPWVEETWVRLPVYSPPVMIGWLFWVNYVLFLLNIILVGFPMDAGRLLQCILWPRVGYRQATLTAVFAGFITCVVLGVFAVWQNEVIVLCLCLFVFISCKNQWMILETGGEDPLQGHYDFSQGYTSLERDEPPPPRVRRQSWWQRWMQQRTAKKVQREQDQKEAEDRRMDELLEKIQRHGRDSLTAEEQRFLKRVSERFRNRQ